MASHQAVHGRGRLRSLRQDSPARRLVHYAQPLRPICIRDYSGPPQAHDRRCDHFALSWRHMGARCSASAEDLTRLNVRSGKGSTNSVTECGAWVTSIFFCTTLDLRVVRCFLSDPFNAADNAPPFPHTVNIKGP